MTKFYSGIAGKRSGKVKGIVIHNDGGSQNANSNFYKNWLPTHDAENGFAHFYVADDGIFQAENVENMAWHTANADGNANYIGVEVCQSLGNEQTFLQNEQKAFKLVAQLCLQLGLKPDYSIFPLHKEFSSTSCPHRSTDLHGGSIQAVRTYFTQQVQKYYNELTGTQNNEQTKGDVAKMFAIYWIPSKSGKGNDAYFFNGVSYEYIDNPDVINILKEVYRKNNNKEIPEYTWNNTGPWWIRLQQPVVNLQELADTVAKIAKKVGV